MPRQRESNAGSFDLADSVTFNPSGPGQTLAIGAASVQSGVMGDGARCVRFTPTVDCWIEVGGNPTAAATTSTFFPAGLPDYLRCGPADKVAVIQASAGGFLYLRPGN